METFISDEGMNIITRIKREPYFTMKAAHLHDYYELYYLLSGRRRIFLEDTLYTVSKGDLILIPKGALHRTTYIKGETHERFCVLLNDELLEPLFTTLRKGALLECFTKPHMKIPANRREYFEHLLSKAHREEQYPDEYSEYLLQAHIHEILFFILRLQSLSSSTPTISLEVSMDNQLMEQAAKFICKNYRTSLTLEETANFCNMSPSYFSKKFKAITGFGFKEYLISIRLREATTLLLNTKLPITEIALLSGFNDSNYFGDVFKRYKGISPYQYRKNNEIL